MYKGLHDKGKTKIKLDKIKHKHKEPVAPWQGELKAALAGFPTLSSIYLQWNCWSLSSEKGTAAGPRRGWCAEMKQEQQDTGHPCEKRSYHQ